MGVTFRESLDSWGVSRCEALSRNCTRIVGTDVSWAAATVEGTFKGGDCFRWKPPTPVALVFAGPLERVPTNRLKPVPKDNHNAAFKNPFVRACLKCSSSIQVCLAGGVSPSHFGVDFHCWGDLTLSRIDS